MKATDGGCNVAGFPGPKLCIAGPHGQVVIHVCLDKVWLFQCVSRRLASRSMPVLHVIQQIQMNALGQGALQCQTAYVLGCGIYAPGIQSKQHHRPKTLQRIVKWIGWC